MSLNNYTDCLPFRTLTDYDLVQENENISDRINTVLEERGFKDYIKNLRGFTDIDDNNNGLKYYTSDTYNQSFFPNKSLKIMHFNVRRLSANRGHLLAYLSGFSKPPDIILLSEIGDDGNNYLSTTFPNYETQYYDLPITNKYGGVAILPRKNLFTNINEQNNLKIELNCGCQNCHCENIWLELHQGDKKFLIGCLYRHNNGVIGHFQNKLNETLSKINNNSICITAGDINIDLLNHQKRDINEYMMQYVSNGFIPQILLPTRITPYSSTLIDHLFIRMPPKLIDVKYNAGILVGDVTDHFPLFLNINENIPRKQNRPYTRIYSEKNFATFNLKLQALDWNSLFIETMNTDEMYECFTSIFTNCFEQSFPLKMVSKKRFKDKKWITTGLRVSIRHKERLYNKKIKKPTMSNIQNYKLYNKKLSQCITKAQDMYYIEIIGKNKDSAINMWKTVGSILNPNNQKKKCSINKLIIEEEELTDKFDITNAFNNFFCTVGEKLAAKIKSNTNFENYLDSPNPHSIYISPIDPNEITREIKLLKPHKSPGHDNISAKLLQSCYPNIITPLTKIFNDSIQTAIYPSKMKLAKVLSLYKKSERYLPENYRPISLLSILDKIYEKLLYSRFIKFIEKYNLLILQQFGFLKFHSTTLALIDHIDKIKEYLDKGEYVLAIYLDLKKAFDTVDPSILFHKLAHYGFRGHALKLIQSYFKDRRQYTIVNNIKSNILNINMGVPQGSVLGPLFFLIYINDIIKCINEEKMTLFADDTTAVMHDNNLDNLLQKGKTCLTKLDEWLKANKLSLHYGKTVFMIYHSKRKKNR